MKQLENQLIEEIELLIDKQNLTDKQKDCFKEELRNSINLMLKVDEAEINNMSSDDVEAYTHFKLNKLKLYVEDTLCEYNKISDIQILLNSSEMIKLEGIEIYAITIIDNFCLRFLDIEKIHKQWRNEWIKRIYSNRENLIYMNLNEKDEYLKREKETTCKYLTAYILNKE